MNLGGVWRESYITTGLLGSGLINVYSAKQGPNMVQISLGQN